MSVDTAALRARLREYDRSLPKCESTVERRTNHAPDHIAEVDRAEWDVVTREPCCRPAGHEGPCRNSRILMGWPGAGTLTALIDEVEELRAWKSDMVEEFIMVTSGACSAPDELHCSCVPHLRKRVEQLKETIYDQHSRIIDDQRVGREAGVTYTAVRDIMGRHLRDDDDGTSFSRMVEELRGLAMGAAERMRETAGNEGG
jgi:hypothetical protein